MKQHWRHVHRTRRVCTGIIHCSGMAVYLYVGGATSDLDDPVGLEMQVWMYLRMDEEVRYDGMISTLCESGANADQEQV